MKLVAVIGEPATGKTTLMRRVMEKLPGPHEGFTCGKLRGRKYHGDIFVLGVYRDGEVFAGTDRLSMAVQPDATKFLKLVPTDACVIFEGDRLTRPGFLDGAKRIGKLALFVVEASEEEKERRHAGREDNQPATFKQGRKTLIQNLTKKYRNARILRNETEADLKINSGLIFAEIEKNLAP